MQAKSSGIVDVLRDFLSAYRALCALFEQHSAGSLQFSEVKALVGDSDASVLYRLKERCHSLFRSPVTGAVPVVRREALFDLAVGSLFHESMKLRESLYQQQIYGPRVAELRSQSGKEDDELFVEFERILHLSALRFDEVLTETEILLAQTRDQFRLLLIDYREIHLLTRFLVAHREQVDEVFPEGLDALLERIHGGVVEALWVAARSHLDSAHFGEAAVLLRDAERREPGRADLKRTERYAAGMQAFRSGEYDASISCLESWVDFGPAAQDRGFAQLAFAALSRIGKLVPPGEEGEATRSAAKELLPRLESLAEAMD